MIKSAVLYRLPLRVSKKDGGLGGGSTTSSTTVRNDGRNPVMVNETDPVGFVVIVLDDRELNPSYILLVFFVLFVVPTFAFRLLRLVTVLPVLANVSVTE